MSPRDEPTSEQRYVDPNTGGEKGMKPEEYGLIPIYPLEEIAAVYGYGAKKYEPHNWTRGYPWTLSVSALFRHIQAWRAGESFDPESGQHHLAHAAFHLFTLMVFEDQNIGTDDRMTY